MSDFGTAFKSLIDQINLATKKAIEDANKAQISVGVIDGAGTNKGNKLHIKDASIIFDDILSVGDIIYNEGDVVLLSIPSSKQVANMYIVGILGDMPAKIIGGTINIGDGTFTVDSDGNVIANSIELNDGIIDGGTIDIGDGTFTVDGSGNVIASSITVDGGTVGGWTIGTNALYRVSSVWGNASGLYFGVNGLSIKDVFKVDANGACTFTSGIVGGWNMSSTYLSKSATGWVYPDYPDLTLLQNYINGTATLTPAQITAFDFNKDGVADITDFAHCKALIYRTHDIAYYVSTYGYSPTNSTINLTINPSSADKTIRMTGTNSFGNTFDRFFGTNGAKTSTFYTGYLECGFLDVQENVDIYGVTNFHDTAYTSSGAVVTSDENAKNSFEPLDLEECANFIYSLIPYSYKYNDGASDRLHHGLKAQDVKKSMGENDWGIYIDKKYDMTNPIVDENGNVIDENGNIIPTKGIRYEEAIADMIGTLQYQNKKITELEEIISNLSEKIENITNTI